MEHSERSEVRVWYTRSYTIDPTSDKLRVQAPPRKEESARLVSIDYCPMVDAAEEQKGGQIHRLRKADSVEKV